MNIVAKKITTSLDWEDLVLNENILQQVLEINEWIKYGDNTLKEMGISKKMKPGYRSLFYGPPGTGKTLTASVLGKSAELDVYRIDLSMMLSKNIGETEKALGSIFNQAESNNWILFFDEADALFGKRTKMSSSNDRYANQETSYLLQKIEDFRGVVILATNLKVNLDEAFTRRFQSMIYFPMPDASQRKILWQNAFSRKSILEDRVNLDDIADKYELTGGAINTISNYSNDIALKRHNNTIFLKDIMEGVRQEFAKAL